ncbi:MAG: dTMP kinase [Chloroflexi bacterium]|nr:dTMP kinase [Chloroflexota bacterium]
MSLFITFEGGEGCGKTVQTRALYRRLTREGIPAVLTHEPGGTVIGEKIARWLKWAHGAGISPLTELLMFDASRAQLVEEFIQPSLKHGKVVICDRFADSTIAYQGYGRGLDLQMVRSINDTAAHGLKPDLTILLDSPAEIGLARKGKGKQDRFHQADIAFHTKVRQGYLKLAAEEPARWLVIDASQSKKEISEIIWGKVRLSLRAHSLRSV